MQYKSGYLLKNNLLPCSLVFFAGLCFFYNLPLFFSRNDWSMVAYPGRCCLLYTEIPLNDVCRSFYFWLVFYVNQNTFQKWGKSMCIVYCWDLY